MKPINPKEIAAWFRDQAKRFNEIADMVEATFRDSSPAASYQGTRILEAVELPDDLTPDNLRAAALKRGSRVKDLANLFSVSEDEILRHIKAPNSGLHVAERGWVKVTDQPKN